MDEHQAFDGHHPASCLLHAHGQGVQKGLEVQWGGSQPLEDSLHVLAIDAVCIMACGLDDHRFEGRVAAWAVT